MHEQQLKDAAMAADASLHIKTIPEPGLNLGPLAPKADALPLSYWDMWHIQQLDKYLLKTAYKGALITHLLSAASNHWFIQLLSEAAF